MTKKPLKIIGIMFLGLLLIPLQTFAITTIVNTTNLTILPEGAGDADLTLKFGPTINKNFIWDADGGSGADGAFSLNDDVIIEENLTVAGSLGIGTATDSPAANLEIKENAGVTDPMLLLNQLHADGDSSIQFINNGGNTFTIGVDASDADKFKISDNTALGTNDRLTINSTGQVGIGLQTDPSYALDIKASTGNIFRFLKSNNGLVWYITDNTSSLYVPMVMDSASLTVNHASIIAGGASGGDSVIRRADTTTTNGEYLGSLRFDSTDSFSSVDGSAVIKAYASEDHGAANKGGYMFFGTKANGRAPNAAATEHMRITQDGKIGIGTDNPDTKLHVKGGLCVDTDDTCTDPEAGNLDVAGKINVSSTTMSTFGGDIQTASTYGYKYNGGTTVNNLVLIDTDIVADSWALEVDNGSDVDWTTLNLTSYTSSTATAAYICIELNDSGSGAAKFEVRKASLTSPDWRDLALQVFETDEGVDEWDKTCGFVKMDAGQNIEYKVDATGSGTASYYMFVGGYVEPTT